MSYIDKRKWAEAVRHRARNRVRFLSIEEIVILLDVALELLIEQLAESGEVSLYQFGKFEVSNLPSRRRFDGLTGELRILPPTQTIRFTAFRHLKRLCEAHTQDLRHEDRPDTMG